MRPYLAATSTSPRRSASRTSSIVGVLHTEIRRPLGLVLHERDLYFRHLSPFMHVLCFLTLLYHCRLGMNVSSHRSGSGRYAVTKTTGLSRPLGTPHTTWMGLPIRSFCKSRTHGPFGSFTYSSITTPPECQRAPLLPSAHLLPVHRSHVQISEPRQRVSSHPPAQRTRSNHCLPFNHS